MKKKKRKSLKEIFKGFTLVELLAVIVILAIIMIIAIPAVLDTMSNARKKSLLEYALKVSNKGEEKYLQDTGFGKLVTSGISYVVYDITKDLGLSSTGNFKGITIIGNNSNIIFKYVVVYDDTYILINQYSGASGNYEPTVEDIIDRSSFESNFGGLSLDSINLKELYAFVQSQKGCESRINVYDGGSNSLIISRAMTNQTEIDKCKSFETEEEQNNYYIGIYLKTFSEGKLNEIMVSN